MILKKILLAGMACLLLQAAGAGPLTTVRVAQGKLQGTEIDRVAIFKGIPFAVPPIGELRWKAPQPAKAWKGVLKADAFKPAGWQIPWEKGPYPMSEDCLYLNVWTPAKSSADRLPVMVWIHGGAFTGGRTASFDGMAFAKKGVLFVSIAYRLGALGFLAHPELSKESADRVSGNYGILDQIAALKWIQKNIASFGGDPRKVTIFGESAGGISVSILCGSPLCKELFRGAICESGGSFGPLGYGRQYNGVSALKDAEKDGEAFAAKAGAKSISDLRKIDAQELLKVQGSFWPNVDGYAILDDQYKLYEQGRYNDVNVMIGTNSDEGAMFSHQSTFDEYAKGLKEKFGIFSDRFEKAYPFTSDEETKTSAADIFRDAGFAWPTYSWAQLQAKTGKARVFVYYFDQPQPADPVTHKVPRGANHASELVYVFKGLNPVTATDSDYKLSEMMCSYWVNFAKAGNPNGKNLPQWPVYDNSRQAVMYLMNTPEPHSWAHKDNLLLMDEFYKYLRNKSK